MTQLEDFIAMHDLLSILKHPNELISSAYKKLTEVISNYKQQLYPTSGCCRAKSQKDECPEDVFFWLLRAGWLKAGWGFTFYLHREPGWQYVEQCWPKKRWEKENKRSQWYSGFRNEPG